MLQYIGSSQEG